MHDKNPIISLIVSTYNRPDALRLVLLALNEQDTDGFEVVIADDGSKDETRKQIELLQHKLAYKLNYVWQADDGYQLSMIRNKAAALAEGNYLIFIDGDSLPLSTFIRYHQRIAEKGYFVSGNRVLLSKNFTTHVLQDNIAVYKWSIFRMWGAYFRNSYNRFSPLVLLPNMPNWLRKLRTKSWRGARSCNLAIWKSDFFAVNGFDESYIGWGYEDSDLVIRLIRQGVLRKDGKYAVPVLHLWHLDNDRGNERHNYKKLEKIMDSSHIRAERGVSQYTSF